MLGLYLLLAGGMLCLSFVFYALGIRPLAHYLYESHQQRITLNLAQATMAFDYIAEGHKQLAQQTASRTAIRNKQIAYLKHQIAKEELVSFSQAKLADALNASSELLGIARYDRAGNFLFRVGRRVPDHIIQACLEPGLPNDAAVSLVQIDSKEHALIYCSSIIDREFGLVGYDVLAISDQDVRDFVNRNKDAMTTYVLASRTGDILYWPDALTQGEVRMALDATHGKQTSKRAILVERSTTTIPDLTLYALVDAALFRAPVKDRLRRLSLVLGFLSLGILLASIVTARPVIRSLLEEQRMRELSRRDLLTGLYNRRALKELFESEVARSRRYGHSLAVVMFDIDHFKQVNDSHGHIAGDEVLQHIGNYCQGFSRRNDSWIRFGGEEFLALLPETDQHAVATYAERLRKGIGQEKIRSGKGLLSVTISGGYCSFTPAEQVLELDEIIGAVDQALYEAKRTGRNKMVPCA